MLQWFSARPVVNKLAYYCYAALIPQQFLAFVLLPLLGRIERAQTLMLAVALGLLVTHGLGYFVPAVGAYPYYDITPAEHPGVSLYLGGSCAPEVAALRSGELIDLTQRRLVGLMAFPSFHAMSAVLVAWAFWSVPYLRWPALMLNVGMVLATPLHGSHYMCETVAGVLLAYPCLMLARRLLRPAGRIFASHSMADADIVWTPAPRRWFQSA